MPFVIKANNGSGTNLFVRSATECEWDRIEAATQRWMSTPYSRRFREWPYELVQPCLLVEPFIGSDGVLPPDYKIYVLQRQSRIYPGRYRPRNMIIIAAFTTVAG